MNTKTIKSGPLYRTLTFDRAAVDEKARTVEVSLTSETPVERWFGMEILDHNKGAVDLSRAEGGPVLVNHNVNDQVGVMEDVRLDSDKKVRATFRFGQSARAKEIWQDVQDGIRKAISVGYRVTDMILEASDKAGETYRATKWQIFEGSLVGIPADASVGVGRAQTHDAENEIKVVVNHDMNRNLLSPDAAEGGNTRPANVAPAGATSTATVTAEDVRKGEALRSREIRAIAKRSGSPELVQLAEQAVEQGTPIEDFRKEAFERVCRGAKPLELQNPLIGMNTREVQSYSLVRALNRIANNKPVDGLEAEASDAMAKLLGRQAQGFYVPHDIALAPLSKRVNLATSPDADGGFTIGTNVLGSSMIELLRNKMIVVALGARTLSGLTGNVSIPRAAGGATAYWLSETGELTATKQAFGQLALTPKRLAAATAYTKNLLVQSSVDIENFVRMDLMTQLAVAKDAAALAGTGSEQPIGVFDAGLTGKSTAVTFAAPATPTWAEIVQFETNVADNNADMGKLAYVVNPVARGKLKVTAKAANTAQFIWEADPQARPGFGMVNGYTAVASKQVPAATNAGFGNWDDCIVADWAGWDVTVDPYSLATTNQVRIIIQTLCDIGFRHAASFAISANAIT
jgi:HK97 family phage major capsid protein/HK97 family phage prohead protease